MLEQFRRFLVAGGFVGAADCRFAQRGENPGVCAGVLELRAETIARTKRQTPRLDFMDDVFIERIASDQSKQLAVGEGFAFLLSACERRTTAESEKDNQVPVNGGNHELSWIVALQV